KPWKPREPWPAEAGEAHFLIGMCHMELKRYLDSLEAFSNAIKLDSSYAEALYQRGVARTKLGMSKGIQDFNKALAINPKIFQAYLSRACYYGHRKNYTKAILNCNEAIKLQTQSVRAFLYRGALKYHIKAFDLAIQDLTKATSIDSSCALGYFNRAVCYQEKKDYQRALTDYGIVLLLGDDLRLQVLINRGLLYFERMDYTNALYDFKMAAKLKTSDQRILHTLGLCYHKMNQLKGALAVFTSCIEKNPAFLDGIIARGNVYMDCGGDGLRYARRDYERALLRDPLCLPARVNLAYTLQVSGKFMQAWTQFTTAIAIRPTFKPALEGRAIINLQMSNTFAAYQDINASIKVGPTAELYTNRGVVNQFMKDHVNAMRDYQAAIQMDPTYALAYFNAANVYFHTRHFRQAHDYYTKAILNNPKDESAFLNRAITKVMLRNAEGALSDFGEALKLSPHTAHMYFNRGNLYSSLGQYDTAEADYSKSLSLKPDDALVLKRRADVLGKLGRKGEAIEDYRLAVEIQSRRKS
ncbi:tetratricopeptide repeat protein 6-like, partial [Mizuhopecten yessoensis]